LVFGILLWVVTEAFGIVIQFHDTIMALQSLLPLLIISLLLSSTMEEKWQIFDVILID
jgi:hypothetical protein